MDISTLLGIATVSNVALITSALLLVYWIGIFIYRITLHPLAKFPGPKLAAVSFWYEFYFDIYPHKLRYLWKIEELHKQYGSIVRINPIHLHIRDPAYIDDIYASGRTKRNRDEWFFHTSKTGPLGWSLFNTVDHDVHRVRRAALSPFFSKRSIHALEGLIHGKINILAERLGDACRTGETVNILYAAGALTMDVISIYAYGKDFGKLRLKDWASEELEGYARMTSFAPIARQFPWLAQLVILLLPPSLVARMSPSAAVLPKNRAMFREMIAATMEESKLGEGVGKPVSRSIFHDMLQSNLSPSDKAPERLAAEATLLLLAGTETTARSLAVIFFHLLDNPSILGRLRKELATCMPQSDSPVTLASLEAIPYFVSQISGLGEQLESDRYLLQSAVILEGVRVSHVVSSRMPKYAPEEKLRYREWVIPAGVSEPKTSPQHRRPTTNDELYTQTRVMQSHYLLHTDPDVFPEPHLFQPQRWLDDPTLKAKYFMAFGRGSRMCLGINLANAELYLTVARICVRFDMELFETVKERDIDVVRDSIIGQPIAASPGIRVKVTRDRAQDGRVGEK